MKVALFGKYVKPDSISFVKELINQLKAVDADIFYNPYIKDIADDVLVEKSNKVFDLTWEIPKDLDFLISIGGDGELFGMAIDINVIYNIGDAINKIGFGLVVYNLAVNSSKESATA